MRSQNNRLYFGGAFQWKKFYVLRMVGLIFESSSLGFASETHNVSAPHIKKKIRVETVTEHTHNNVNAVSFTTSEQMIILIQKYSNDK